MHLLFLSVLITAPIEFFGPDNPNKICPVHILCETQVVALKVSANDFVQ